MEKQRTILKEIRLNGIGLHTGKKTDLVLRPAEVDSGIIFSRVDLPGCPQIKACADNIVSYSLHPARRTSIAKDGVGVHTIEHLMAALFGLGIDNILIEINNEEVPGLDGSSLDFLDALNESGIVQQEKERHTFIIKDPVFIEESGCSIIALPSSDFKISYTLDYRHPFLKTQFMELSVNNTVFQEDIASARTFCLQQEALELQQQGLGLGANHENTLVVGENGVVKNKLRYEDEFIRHKILDLIGDLYLLGFPLKGHIIAMRSGHSLNAKLVKKIVQQRIRYASAGIGTDFHGQDAAELDIGMIMKILPHREPFLFVDRITQLEKGKRAVGIKNVTINDYFFKGHFPGKPVMPGVLIIEAMAQVGGVMMLAAQENWGKLAYFMAADKVKFRKTVLPGDQLVMEITAGKIKSKTGQVFAKATVDGKVVAEAELMFALAEY
jgi:UDP-3-O-[3-hydroxymyristoyl] N-acetylglucosamine deacetylase/3-hydroxyacyl-[acyl-carrier-protein] dehydratase